MRKITVTFENPAGAQSMEVNAGTPLREILPENTINGLPVLAALMNNDVVSLFQPVNVNSKIRLLTLDDDHGWRVYRWSLCFLLAKAAQEATPELEVRVRHAFGTGLFCTIEGKEPLDRNAAIEKLSKKLREYVARDVKIERTVLGYEEALESFKAAHEEDKLYLLRHRNPPTIAMADCEGYLGLLQEPMVDHAGLLQTFALSPYEEGFVLRLPFKNAPHTLAPLKGPKHLSMIFKEHIRWGEILGVTTASELNQIVMRNEIDEFIRVAEALHDKKLADIASQIAERSPEVRLILLAGPSSSGKTTTAKRITTHLRVLGLRPFMISTDNYFVGDEDTPRDENGNLDYEHIHAMNLELLNDNIIGLLKGEEVEMPKFDFRNHRPFPTRTKAHLEPGQVIIMEGIHCLNPELTSKIPRENKFLIYISALTQLAVDRCCRVSTTDNRLLRRLVRDNQFRSRPAVESLQMWPSVRRGESRWIFPFQDLADATFNSALDYEIGVLKPYANALLNTVKPSMPEYAEARRLTAMLQNFMIIPQDAVPGDSILRECIGGSQLSY